MTKATDGRSPTRQRVPRMQLLFDDVFLLLLVGLIVPTVFFIIWGLISLTSVPPFTR